MWCDTCIYSGPHHKNIDRSDISIMSVCSRDVTFEIHSVAAHRLERASRIPPFINQTSSVFVRSHSPK